jgi:hypothetical protein
MAGTEWQSYWTVCSFAAQAKANNWVSHSAHSEDISLEQELVFRRDISLLSSRLKNIPSKKSVFMQVVNRAYCQVSVALML